MHLPLIGYEVRLLFFIKLIALLLLIINGLLWYV